MEYIASRVYAEDLNEFDGTVRLAERALKLYPSDKTRKNYRKILKIRNFCLD